MKSLYTLAAIATALIASSGFRPGPRIRQPRLPPFSDVALFLPHLLESGLRPILGLRHALRGGSFLPDARLLSRGNWTQRPLVLRGRAASGRVCGAAAVGGSSSCLRVALSLQALKELKVFWRRRNFLRLSRPFGLTTPRPEGWYLGT